MTLEVTWFVALCAMVVAALIFASGFTLGWTLGSEQEADSPKPRSRKRSGGDDDARATPDKHSQSKHSDSLPHGLPGQRYGVSNLDTGPLPDMSSDRRETAPRPGNTHSRHPQPDVYDWSTGAPAEGDNLSRVFEQRGWDSPGGPDPTPNPSSGDLVPSDGSEPACREQDDLRQRNQTTVGAHAGDAALTTHGPLLVAHWQRCLDERAPGNVETVFSDLMRELGAQAGIEPIVSDGGRRLAIRIRVGRDAWIVPDFETRLLELERWFDISAASTRSAWISALHRPALERGDQLERGVIS